MREDSATPGARSSLGLLDLLEFVTRHLRVLLLAGVAGALVLLILAFLSPRTFTSTTVIVPDSRGAPANRLAGLAAQFGVFTSVSAGTLPAPLFVELVRSKQVLGELAAAPYDALDGRSLVDHLEVTGDSEAHRIERAAEELRESLEVTATPETGAVEIAISASTPDLARQLVQRALFLLDSLSLLARQRQAGLEQVFFQERLREASDSVREASSRVVRFLEKNRLVANAPSLVFQLEQLQQQAAGAQALYQSLQQSYETARLDAARSVPTFLIVEQPAVPAVPDRRGALIKALLGGILGVAVPAAWLVFREWWQAVRIAHPDRAARLASALRLRG